MGVACRNLLQATPITTCVQYYSSYMTDLVHPLTKLVWGKNQGKLALKGYARWKQCAVVQEKIFITTEYKHIYTPKDHVSLVKYSAYHAPIADLGSWAPFSVPAVRGFALTTYHSQLVLVGGWTDGKKVLNTLWASADGTNWQETLPPMPTSRYGAAVVNTGSSGGPECLVVAGGKKGPEKIIDTVEVLTEGQWSTVSPLPISCCFQHHFIFHNGGVYLCADRNMFYCQLHSLLASDEQSSPWQTMSTPCVMDLVSFQGHLLCLEHRINAYCPLQQCWVCVGKMYIPVEWAIVSPTGQLIVFMHEAESEIIVGEATFRGKFFL